MSVTKQSGFDRTLRNEGKLGAYYTNQEMCRRMSHLISFPEGEEVSVLEPSCGDVSALNAVLGGDRKDVKIFGIELNSSTFRRYAKEQCDYALNADFLSGIKISHRSFGFCFANPPYGEEENGERLEKLFVEKIWNYLKPGAPFIAVLPYYLVKTKSFLRIFLARFEMVECYSFDEKEYQEFQQVVLLGVTRRYVGCRKEYLESWELRLKEREALPYLPTEPVEHPCVAVSSKEEGIEYFTTLAFDRTKAASRIPHSALHGKVEEFFTPKFTGSIIGRPPVPLKTDLLYLLSVSGGGQGKVGSEETQDLHLQRGVAKVVTQDSEVVNEETGKASTIVERSFTQIVLNVVQNDGVITQIQ